MYWTVARTFWVVFMTVPLTVARPSHSGFVRSQFPRPGLAPLYTQLLRVWADVRQGSTFPPDGEVLLVLPSAVLQRPELDEREVAGLVRGWWDARRVPALLPAVEAVRLLAGQLADPSAAQGL
jgi:hypothetical protein